MIYIVGDSVMRGDPLLSNRGAAATMTLIARRQPFAVAARSFHVGYKERVCLFVAYI